MPKYNDLDPKKWREYEDIYTDSLWIIDKRDNSGAHSNHYHGNFVPQISYQLCALVIGDKYANSQVDPLGFKTMNCFIEKGFKLKAILVKNFGDTKGKKNQQGIWRYRAISNDFYIFKHEYIFIFKK